MEENQKPTGETTTPETTEYDLANAEIEKILGSTQPKHLGEGLVKGMGYMVRGALRAGGALVLMPTVAMAEGKKEAGVIGGIAGGAGGLVAGVAQGVNLFGGGVVTGMSQIARGVTATPTFVIAPTRGYWWNDRLGQWVQTKLLEEEQWIKTEPVYDEDILGEMALPEEERPSNKTDKNDKVKDMYYYDKLGVDCDVDSDVIERRYSNLQRKYFPTRCGANCRGAQEKLEEIREAYSVLRNPVQRAKYDKVGRAGICDNESESNVDPLMLYTHLFGSEKFNDHIGRLIAVASTRVGCNASSKLTLNESKILQRRRVTRLALKLAERLSKWAEDGDKDDAMKMWEEEAKFLCDASYGAKLVNVIGKVYTFTAVHFLGSTKSGIGMPSISRWATKNSNAMMLRTNQAIETTRSMVGNADRRKMHLNVSTAIEKSAGDEELENMAMESLKKSKLQKNSMDYLWQETVLDITSTVKEAAQMVLNDQNVSPITRKARAEALEICGGLFENSERSDDPCTYDEKRLEQIAFHAMLSTVWKQEKSAAMRG
mmetsp:Transcript_62736/g.127825  ORF Transcript_62736/g.127825 Transcript_62736/m.127825 type:complete len:543 (-) Transcript_62736:1410-3038(-)|eukprot:CAMPEP_0201203922 /NCGR_PEP_ID=MMETSP0851-20130426/167878_1 /ASSEMBLY_ACC=CAM_ASM_000631 /TAXON_ID=183588 /ORGANISM="Pseudo-nitzschia fraudulenta, Strain WWA7" /LENGTH=542 /DNA_ID=CAMNT_0047491957 /DNA_START=161 /DNA_END=1789 /DNA_ORIENTATION=+